MDYAKGRVYLPQEDMEFFHVSDETIANGVATPEFRALMRYEVDYARELFEEGMPLIEMADSELALDLDLFTRGGLEILRAIERQGFDVLTRTAGDLEADQARACPARGCRQELPFRGCGRDRRGRRRDGRIEAG